MDAGPFTFDRRGDLSCTERPHSLCITLSYNSLPGSVSTISCAVPLLYTLTLQVINDTGVTLADGSPSVCDARTTISQR